MSFSLPAKPPLVWAVRVLSFAAMVVCVVLLAMKLTGQISSLKGCGDAKGCEDVMGGEWSEWFHIPVTALAAWIYAVVILLTLPPVQRALGRTGDQLLAAAGVVLMAAAVYFLSILYFVIKGHCPWCLGLHITGLTVGGLILSSAVQAQRGGGRGVMEAAMLTGFMAMCVLSAGQIWGPKPQGFLITTGTIPEVPATDAASPVPAVSVPSATPAAAGTTPPRTVGFFGDRMKFDPASLPVVGRPDARIVLVEFFDYTCTSCRDLSGDLKALRKKWPGTFAVIVLPAPLSRACNPLLRDSVPEHQGACDLARLALGVWRTKPAVFPEYHEYLLGLPLPVTPMGVENARKKAVDVAGAASVTAASEDPWVSNLLQENAASLQKLSQETIKMPKLLLKDTTMMHGSSRSTEDFITALENQFSLKEAGAQVLTKPQ